MTSHDIVGSMLSGICLFIIITSGNQIQTGKKQIRNIGITLACVRHKFYNALINTESKIHESNTHLDIHLTNQCLKNLFKTLSTYKPGMLYVSSNIYNPIQVIKWSHDPCER